MQKELISEFLWYQRYIGDHDLETQMEIKDDKIVFRVGENLIEWDVDEARRIRTKVMNDAAYSYMYARDVIKGRFELGEPVISKNAYYSYRYARYVIKGRFELGEPAISKHVSYSLWYSRDVIRNA